MDPQVESALITSLGYIAAAAIGGLLFYRLDIIDTLLSRNKFLRLVGRWDSSWQYIDDPKRAPGREILVIERQKGSRIYGSITTEDYPDKKWEFEGNFTGHFLHLLYYPSKEADDKLFLDYGCYFFEMNGDGSFEGYSIGYDLEYNSITISKHRISKIKK